MSQTYVGSELELFASALNWKRYVGATLRPHLGSRVLEVGAGIGANIQPMASESVKEWVALEPDPAQAQQIRDKVSAGSLPAGISVVTGTLSTLDDPLPFDTILYIDVLEHIEDDAAELRLAMTRLAPGGRLVVLVPAFQFLFSPFDTAIGHFRRYSIAALRRVGPPGARLQTLRMIDSVGFFASLANRLLLRSAAPTMSQVRAWDNLMVPISRWLDPLLGHRLGKSVLAVWSK